MTTTIESQITIAEGVLDTVREHVNPYLEQEVGGFLVGSLADGRATIEHALPALEAVGHRAQLTFTHGVWEEMLAKVDRDFPDLRIVGWYHSHPGFGIFLSDYDKFIHSNFFSAPGMVALVVDPQSGEEGWFGWENGDGDADDRDIVQIEGLKTPARESRFPDGARPSTRGPGTGTAVLVGAVVAVAAFAVGYAVGGSGRSQPQPPPPVVQTPEPTPDVPEEPDRDGDVGGPVAATTGRVVIDYRVRPGDSLWALAESFYGSGFSYEDLVTANPGVDAGALEVGGVLRVPVQGEPGQER